MVYVNNLNYRFDFETTHEWCHDVFKNPNEFSVYPINTIIVHFLETKKIFGLVNTSKIISLFWNWTENKFHKNIIWKNFLNADLKEFILSQNFIDCGNLLYILRLIEIKKRIIFRKGHMKVTILSCIEAMNLIVCCKFIKIRMD